MAKHETIIGQAAELAKLVDYQAGAVVSRTLSDKTAGTIPIFAFDAGHGLSEHSAPYDAFVYAIDGEVEVILSPSSCGVAFVVVGGTEGCGNNKLAVCGLFGVDLESSTSSR